MAKYLAAGNILLPLLCVNSQPDECACSIFEEGKATTVNVLSLSLSFTTNPMKFDCMKS